MSERIDIMPPPRTAISHIDLRILTCAAGGDSNRAIGEQLGLTTRSTAVRLSRIYRKLGARGRAHAVAIACRRGLIDPQRIEPREDRSA